MASKCFMRGQNIGFSGGNFNSDEKCCVSKKGEKEEEEGAEDKI